MVTYKSPGNGQIRQLLDKEGPVTTYLSRSDLFSSTESPSYSFVIGSAPYQGSQWFVLEYHLKVITTGERHDGTKYLVPLVRQCSLCLLYVSDDNR